MANYRIDPVISSGRKAEFLMYEGKLSVECGEAPHRLMQAADELGCDLLTVITWDYEAVENYKGKILNFTPLWKWLLR